MSDLIESRISEIRTNYILAHELLETAAWISAREMNPNVHVDRLTRAVRHLRGEHVERPPTEQTDGVLRESPPRTLDWLLRNDPWAAAIAAHVRQHDRAHAPSDLEALLAEREGMKAEIAGIKKSYDTLAAEYDRTYAQLNAALDKLPDAPLDPSSAPTVDHETR